MPSTDLHWDDHPPVARVTLARPARHNALDEGLIAALTEAFTHLATAPGVRAVVLDAEGKSFCAGADLGWMRRAAGFTWDDNVADAQRLAAMLSAIRDCPRPVVARVQGPAYGGGLGLIAACDMAVAMESATFRLSETCLGLIPAVISPFLLDKLGPGPLRRYALTGEAFDAPEAHRLGLLSAVQATPQELDAWVAQVTGALLETAPEAVAACKQLLQTLPTVAHAEQARWTSEQIARLRAGAEATDRLRQFLEARGG